MAKRVFEQDSVFLANTVLLEAERFVTFGRDMIRIGKNLGLPAAAP